MQKMRFYKHFHTQKITVTISQSNNSRGLVQAYHTYQHKLLRFPNKLWKRTFSSRSTR